MRLDYHVLCIDDKIDSLSDMKRQLISHNNNVGIKTNFIDISVKKSAREIDVGDFRNRIFNSISISFKENTIDLIIVDLHLGDIKGHEIIQYIRDGQTMYRPIVFYSGGEPENYQNATTQLTKGLQENNLVGKSVFLSARGQNLIRDLKGICSEMHHEEHKLNATRGLLMDRTSEIDAKILNHLKKENTWKNLDSSQKNKIANVITKEFERKSKKASKSSCQLQKLSKQTLEEFSTWICTEKAENIIRILDAFSRNNIMREWLKLHSNLRNNGDIHSSYFKPPTDTSLIQLTSIRDQYAHQTENQIKTSHNDEKCKYIRDQLRIHLNNVNEATK